MALHSASYWRKIDVVQLLLEHGASTNVEASTGATPLHSVSWAAVFAPGANIGPKKRVFAFGRLLLEHGADVSYGRVRSGQTSIDSATRNQRLQLAQLLLENVVKFHAQRPRTS
ncbi:hypothetical protein EDB85DRAFT_1007094 [Lactarius pseudohatsudake]|nr:hypothetical protein EDB85DRAFT_1007094 [Lactarius pseudohatsudake]